MAAIATSESLDQPLVKQAETKSEYAKRCWDHLIRHESKKARRAKAEHKSYNPKYTGDLEKSGMDEDEIIKRAHISHYMGLLKHEMGSHDHTWEDLLAACRVGDWAVGELDYNNRNTGWTIYVSNLEEKTKWHKDMSFSIDSCPKDSRIADYY